MAHGDRGRLDEADLLLSKAYVDGHWAVGNAVPIEVDDPFTLETVSEVPDLSQAQVTDAIEGAARAFPTWRGRAVPTWATRWHMAAPWHSSKG